MKKLSMKKLSCTSIILLFLAVFVLSGCGGGSSGTTVTQPTAAVVKLLSSGTGTTIGGIDMTIELPAGVSVMSTITPTTDAGVVTASGVAATGSFIYGVYTAATSTGPATLKIVLANATGFDDGEFCTVNGSLEAGYSPSASDFVLASFTAYDVSGNTISGVTPTFTVELQ